MSNVEIYYKYCFNTAYCFGQCPFRFGIVTNPSEQLFYTTKCWLPQKILCVFLFAFQFLSDLQQLRETIPGHSDRKNPVKYFLFLGMALYLVQKMITIKIVWLNQQEIVDVVNFIRSGVNMPARVTRLLSPILVGLVIFLHVVPGVIAWLYDANACTTSSLDGTVNWRLAGWWHAMVGCGWGMFFIDWDRNSVATENLHEQDYSNMDMIMGTLGAIGRFQTYAKLVQIHKFNFG